MQYLPRLALMPIIIADLMPSITVTSPYVPADVKFPDEETITSVWIREEKL